MTKPTKAELQKKVDAAAKKLKVPGVPIGSGTFRRRAACSSSSERKRVAL